MTEPTNNPNETPLDMTWDYCPSCGSELDTGFECLRCKRDWRPWTMQAEVERRADAVVDAAVEWHQSDADWFEKSEVLSASIESLLELRVKELQ